MRRVLALILCWWLCSSFAVPLRVCVEPWYPFIYQEAGMARGLLPDALARAPELSFSYRFMAIAGCEKLMQQQKVDVVAFADADHSPRGWLTTRQTLVSWVLYPWVSVNHIETRLSPASRRLAWVSAYDYPGVLHHDTHFVRVPTIDADEAAALLANGRVDVMYDDPFVTVGLDPAIGKRIRRLPQQVAALPQPLALRPGLEAVRDRIDQVAKQMWEDGSLAVFYQHFFGASLGALGIERVNSGH